MGLARALLLLVPAAAGGGGAAGASVREFFKDGRSGGGRRHPRVLRVSGALRRESLHDRVRHLQGLVPRQVGAGGRRGAAGRGTAAAAAGRGDAAGTPRPVPAGGQWPRPPPARPPFAPRSGRSRRGAGPGHAVRASGGGCGRGPPSPKLRRRGGRVPVAPRRDAGAARRGPRLSAGFVRPVTAESRCRAAVWRACARVRIIAGCRPGGRPNKGASWGPAARGSAGPGGGARRPPPLCGEPRRRRRKCAVIDSGHLNTPSQKRAAGGCGAPCRRGAARHRAGPPHGEGSGAGEKPRLVPGCGHRAARLPCRKAKGELPVLRVLTCSGCFFRSWVSLASKRGIAKYVQAAP